MDGRAGYISAGPDSSKFTSSALGSSLGTNVDDYIPSGYKGDQYSLSKGTEYTPTERRYYGEPQSTFIGRDLPPDPVRRYADSSVGHQTQVYFFLSFFLSF